MTRFARTTLFLLIAGLCAACMTAPDKKYFHLSLASRPSPQPIDMVLYVDYPGIVNPYNDFRIVYRVSPFEVSYYPYVFWTDKAGAVVRDAVARFLKAGGDFRSVILETDEIEPDLVLKSRIQRIEEVDEGDFWYAHLAVEFKVADYKSGKILAARTFDRREPMASKSVLQFPVTVSRILAEELDAVLSDLRSSVSALRTQKRDP